MKRLLTTLTLAALAFALLMSFSNESLAWGGRGHHAICEAASFLVKEPGLREYLTTRPHMMGHLCNIPDFHWKSLGGEFNKWGNPTHFVDVEIIGLKASEVPTDYKSIIRKYEGKKNHFKEGTIFSIPTEFGSVWWRADQFFRRAVDQAPLFKKAALPKGFKEEQDESLPYNKAAYDFVVNLGLMGHFVGDCAQPFHSTMDYDGYGAGHGGIHAFYEDSGVSVQPYDLTARVVEAARELQIRAESKKKEERSQVPFLKAKTVIERMRALSEVSLSEIPAIYAADPVIKPSARKSEKGMDIKTAAERESAEKSAEKFGALIRPQMARAAALLAQLWDEAYVKAGRPKLAAYKSYKYPFTPDFVFPDYHEIPKPESK